MVAERTMPLKWLLLLQAAALARARVVRSGAYSLRASAFSEDVPAAAAPPGLNPASDSDAATATATSATAGAAAAAPAAAPAEAKVAEATAAEPTVAAGDYGTMVAATDAAMRQLKEAAWPTEVANVSTASLADLSAVAKEIVTIRQLRDEWARHCTSRKELAERLFTIASNEQAGADLRVAQMTTKLTQVQAKEQETMIKLGNLENRCFEQKKLCARQSTGIAVEQANLAKSQSVAQGIAEAAGDLLTGEAKKHFDKVQGALDSQTEKNDAAADRNSDSCAAQMLFLDEQVEKNSATEHAVAEKRVHLDVEKTGAMKFQKVAMKAADEATATKENVEKTCKTAADKAEVVLEALRDRRNELRKAAGSEGVVTDCRVTEWNAEGSSPGCTAKCGGGTRPISREILVKPAEGGDECPSLMATTLQCSQEPCAQDCEMGAWSAWTECSATCGGGIRARRRSITKNPIGAGAACGAFSEHEVCNAEKSCGRTCKPSEIVA